MSPLRSLRLATRPDRPVPLTAWPLDRPRQWLRRVNAAETAAELADVRRCVQRGTPIGEQSWALRAAARLGLESTLRPRGRPRKEA